MRRVTALLTIALLVAACGGSSAGTGGQLSGTRWVLRSFEQDGAQVLVEGDAYADATFERARVSGFGGCGTYDAVTQDAGRLLFVSAPRTTLQSCGEDLDAFQSTYLGLLETSRSYSVRRDMLTIFDADRTAILIFDAGARNPLLGHWDVDSFATAPGTVTAPLEDTTLSATFRLTQVGGSAGCNTFAGTYGTNGNVVAIGPLATTQMACDEDVMEQETAFLAALGGIGFVEPRGNTLLLSDRNGNTSVVLVRPGEEPEATPSPTPTEKPTATPTAKPTASPTDKPSATPSPTPEPTPSPTPKPSPSPSPSTPISPSAVPSASPAPTVTPPSPMPSTATCSVDGAAGTTVNVAYPATWYTLAEPPGMACRYFDPAPITVPENPLTLQTAVMIQLQANVAYVDAVAAATDQTNWRVAATTQVTVAGYQATLVDATALTTDSGYPVDTVRYAYLIDLGANGTVYLQTTGAPGPGFDANKVTVDVIASGATITAPG